MPSIGVAGSKTVEYCAQHALKGMVDVKYTKCRTEGCVKGPSFGVADAKTAEYCSQQAPHGMVNVRSSACRTERCGKRPLFGVTGTETVEYCTQHAPEGTVDVKNKKGITEGCGIQPSFGVTGIKAVEYRTPFAPNRMVDACSRNSTTGGCGKKLSFGVANTRTVEYHAQNTRLGCGVEGYREREVSPHRCGKETIGGVIPSGGKHTDAHPLLSQASPPSGRSRGSRKRARHSKISCTASERAITGESTGEIVTMPDIDGQKSPVNRDSAMKTEVQLYL